MRIVDRQPCVVNLVNDRRFANAMIFKSLGIFAHGRCNGAQLQWRVYDKRIHSFVADGRTGKAVE